MKLLLTFLGMIGLVFAITQTTDPSTSSTTHHQLLEISEEEASVERWAQVKKCGQCHQQAYENWLKGPHANAYQKLQEHHEYVHRSPNFDKNYARLVRVRSETCEGCHLTANIYENHLSSLPLQTEVTQSTWEDYPDIFELPKARPIAFDTGIDCLTCHAKGNQVVTNADFAPSQATSTEACLPIGSNVFSSNLNCISCHKEQVTSQHELLAEGHDLADQSCVGCHQEYNAEGQGTHYYYWRNNPADKPTPEHLNPFAGVEIEILNTPRGSDLQFSWENIHSPHGFSECGEAITYLAIEDEQGIQHWADTFRLNRRQTHAPMIERFFTPDDVPGITGHSFHPASPPLIVTHELPNSLPESGRIRLRGDLKAQYWANDAVGNTVFSKIIPFSKPLDQ